MAIHHISSTGKISLLLLAALLLVPFASNAYAEGAYKIIKTDELLKLHGRDVWDFYIYDARNPGEYEEVHVKGAVPLPQKKFDEYKMLLPSDKSVKIIFYCNGYKCGKSKKAAKMAVDSGYANVFVYLEGMPVWEEKGLPVYKGPTYEKKIQTTIISPSELHKLVSSKNADYTLVDVRDKEEYMEGHIPTSINIPVASFSSRSDALDKHKKIIVYCNSGGRSYQAYRKLMKLGYKNIEQGIFADWKEAGYAVQK